jgi:hypothetical protein
MAADGGSTPTSSSSKQSVNFTKEETDSSLTPVAQETQDLLAAQTLGASSQSLDTTKTSSWWGETLREVNKDFSETADKLAAEKELNGFFVLGTIAKPIAAVTDGLSKLSEPSKSDIQGMGNSAMKRFIECAPEVFNPANKMDSVKWVDPKTKEQYRFAREGGGVDKSEDKDSAKDKEKEKKYLPMTVTAYKLDSSGKATEQVFQATSLNNGKDWAISECDFTERQLEALSRAQNSSIKETQTASSWAQRPQGEDVYPKPYVKQGMEIG